MKHKGYTAKIEVDTDAGIIHGEIADIADVITFQAESMPDLRREFEAAVDDYLEFCREQGREANRPYSGRFVVRVHPELHRTAAVEAKLSGQSLNAWVAAAMHDRATRGPDHRDSAELYGALASILRVKPEGSNVVQYLVAADAPIRKMPVDPKTPQGWEFLASPGMRPKVVHGN